MTEVCLSTYSKEADQSGTGQSPELLKSKSIYIVARQGEIGNGMPHPVPHFFLSVGKRGTSRNPSIYLKSRVVHVGPIAGRGNRNWALRHFAPVIFQKQINVSFRLGYGYNHSS